MNTTKHRHSGTRRRPITRPIAAALLGATLLTGCQQANQSLFIGDMSSAYNREIWWMSVWAIVLSIIIFVGVSYALFYTINKFREDKHDAPPRSSTGTTAWRSSWWPCPW
ncbi:hypothetical protein [Deinococcus aquaticus]|uniref:hypothetical protein n=1 Tax=Deinococcus aquaticus TaxID=328692 RepID=UPI0036198F4B